MDRIRLLLSSVMAFALLSSASQIADAAESSAPVRIRSSDKEDYSRIVFDWQKLPPYTTQLSDSSLVLKFTAQTDLSKASGKPSGLERVTGYQVVAPDTVKIDFIKGANVRHFVIDNRLVIDIRGAAAAPAPKTVTDKDVARVEPAAADGESASGHSALKEQKNEPKKDEPKKDAATGAPVDLAAPVAAKKDIPHEIPQETPHEAPVAPSSSAEAAAMHEEAVALPTFQVVINATQSIPVAAFVRNGFLWVVEDKPDIKIPPQIVGKGGESLSFQRLPQDGVSVFRVPVPDGVNFVASGGGLVWKIEVGPDVVSSQKPTEFKRLFGDEAQDGGPSLVWTAPSLNRIAEIVDPDAGDMISVGMVESAKDFSGDAHSYVDFSVLPSPVGFAGVAKVDDLKISKIAEGVQISRPEGLTLSRDKDILSASETKSHEEKPADQEMTRVFDFAGWQMGTEKELSDNQRLMLSGMSAQTETKKAETLIGLAKLVLSFNYAPEALGYLELAQSIVPELDSNPEFICLRGAAEALSWKQKEGFNDFSAAGVQDIGEVAFWKAYTLAKLDDWQQAAKILPKDVSLISTYTDDVRNPVALTLAEVALREGNIPKAKKILEMLAPAREKMKLPHAAGYDYLTGELDRQAGKKDEAKKIWKELTTSKDDLYRAKARFALTMLQMSSKEITVEKAIDSLEGLRYAWRGDDLEVSINYNLAKIYLDKGEPVKALTLMKLAHSLNPNSEQGKQIDRDMRAVFKGLFAADKINSLNPVDVLTVYNEFADLIPAGAEGEALTRQLVERLANADLLPRAITLLKKQVDGGTLQGMEAATVTTRLAALETMDGRADEALQSLDKAEAHLKGLPAEEVLAQQRDIGLLRAKAQSIKGKPDDAFAALALLPQDDNTLRLRADIAWRNKKWQDAADALQQLVQNQDISLTRPLNDEQADMILNWAVALYLADNRYVLANVRERFSDAMAATPKAQKFEVITRPRQASLLADRETINSIIGETVIFKDFLKSFKAGDPVPAKTEGAAQIAPETVGQAEGSAATTPAKPAQIPESLRNLPGLKADDVLGD